MSEVLQGESYLRQRAVTAAASLAVVAGLTACSTGGEGGPLLTPEDIKAEQYNTQLLLPCHKYPQATMQLPKFAVLGSEVHAYVAGPSADPREQLTIKVLNAEESDVILEPNNDVYWLPTAPYSELKHHKNTVVWWPDGSFKLRLKLTTKKHRQFMSIAASCDQ
jgi:hypothetical protein